MRLITNIAVAALALTAAAGTSSAQMVAAKTNAKVTAPKHRKVETEADLMKIAKVSKEAATTTALARVPGATVSSSELEREHGKLLWSFDLKTAGKTGIDEVQVDAMTGAVIGKTVHESPKTEKKEARQEAKEKK
ncbi:MAG: PepSY domain-containing protein [Gemmatimonadaceae bacterium]|nr:PepSY domain-containing protein [Gemmatimonadaceae bacterium]